MARATFVKKARKDYPEDDIKKGDSYWHWKFRYGSIHRSKTQPKQSQLTQSEHLGNMYAIVEDLETLTIDDVADGFLQEYIDRAQDIYDTCDERKSAMPDQLQESQAGETLQSYMDACESFISDLESIDTDIPDFLDEAESEWDDDNPQSDDRETWIQERAEEMQDERKQEILDEVQGIDFSV